MQTQLIKLHQKTDAKGACLEVLETYTNLGPIKDFCVVDPLRQGQCQVVTCVGAHKDSSLRLVGNGIYKLVCLILTFSCTHNFLLSICILFSH